MTDTVLNTHVVVYWRSQYDDDTHEQSYSFPADATVEYIVASMRQAYWTETIIDIAISRTIYIHSLR